MAAPLTVAAALRVATARLVASETARLDAELLLAHCLGTSRSKLYASPEAALDNDTAARYDTCIEARARHMPLAYLTGHVEFWSLAFQVTPAVLIPRPETELLVELALAAWPAARAGVALDLGTGSGAVAAALAHERAALTVVASDRSADALTVASGNFARLGLAQIACLQGDWLAPLAAASCDVIVSNPPYIGRAEHVDAAVEFEPAPALFAAREGRAALVAIVARAPQCLKKGGFIALEHGHQQGAAVRAMLATAGLVRIATHRDLAGHERVSCAWRA